MCHLLLLCFLFLISLAEMGNSITERIWFVTLRCLPLHVAFEIGGIGILPFFFCDSVALCMCRLCSSPGKEERHVFIKKKNTKARSREMTNLSLFVIGIY